MSPTPLSQTGSRLRICPIGIRAASAFVNTLHRHHKASRGWKFGVAVRTEERIVGVAMCGRPVARALDGEVIEVNRVCTDGTKNACSALYGAAVRVSREMGYRWAITYTLWSESGTSLIASGWWGDHELSRGRSWDCPSRPRSTEDLGDKRRWVKWLGGEA